MIVLSALLVAAAIVLLIVGIVVKTTLAWVWASIAVSVLAGIFLIVGALQRRQVGEVVAATDEPRAVDEVPTVTAVRRPERDTAKVAAAATETLATATVGDVVVVPGRPRYHRSECRFLAGADNTETLSRTDAKSDGYQACGVCRPDDVTAPVHAARATTARATTTRTAAARKPAAKKPAAKKAAASTTTRAAAAAAASRAAARVAASKPAKKAAPAAKKAAAKKAAPAKKAPAKKAAAKKAPAKKAAAKKPAAKKATRR